MTDLVGKFHMQIAYELGHWPSSWK